MSIEEGTFSRVFRGYETTEVDKALGRLRRELMLAKTELDKQNLAVAELTERVTMLADQLEQVGQPTFSGLGKELMATVNAAEDQAMALVSQAKADAYNLKLAGDRERERSAESTKALADAILNRAKADADELVARATMQASHILGETDRRALETLKNAQHAATDVHRHAVTEVSRERADAARSIQHDLAQAEREMAELRLVTAAQLENDGALAISDEIMELLRVRANDAVAREELERELLVKHAEASVSTQKYVDDAKHQVQTLQARKLDLTRETEELTTRTERDLTQLRSAVDSHAIEMLARANAESARIVSEAQAQARDLLADAQNQLTSIDAQRAVLSQHLDEIRTVITRASKSTAARTTRKKPVA